MDPITQEIRLNNWREIIKQCMNRPEGQTAKEWLSQNSISRDAYYYWQRKIRIEEALKLNSILPVQDVSKPEPVFAEIPVSTNALPFMERSGDASPLGDVLGRVCPERHTTRESLGTFSPDVIIQTSTCSIGISNSVSEHLLSIIMEAFHVN